MSCDGGVSLAEDRLVTAADWLDSVFFIRSGKDKSL